MHGYSLSPFSQKVAWALNYKNVAYKTVTISPVEPRPLRRPLDGGYRKTPILQIGNQVFCDTARILDEIEKRYPEPSLFPATRAGRSSEILSKAIRPWLDSSLFMMIPSQFDVKKLPAELLKDRAAFAGRKTFLDPASPYLRAELFAQLARAEQLIPQNNDTTDGIWILDTPTVSAADLSLAMDSLFAVNTLGRDFVHHFPRLAMHLKRVTVACHAERAGSMADISAEEALAIARTQAEPYTGPTECTLPLLSVGQQVEVTPIDTGKIPATGKLLALSNDGITIEHVDVASNTTCIIHFPTIGFVVTPMRGNL
ncbi:glutathione S-transferase [Dichotomocladium elegans]|nr:glutathione S-transferase [Dichotomocladium elegans]